MRLKCGSARVLHDPESNWTETVHCDHNFRHSGCMHEGVTQELARLTWIGALSESIQPREDA